MPPLTKTKKCLPSKVCQVVLLSSLLSPDCSSHTLRLTDSACAPRWPDDARAAGQLRWSRSHVLVRCSASFYRYLPLSSPPSLSKAVCPISVSCVSCVDSESPHLSSGHCHWSLTAKNSGEDSPCPADAWEEDSQWWTMTERSWSRVTLPRRYLPPAVTICPSTVWSSSSSSSYSTLGRKCK